MIYKECSHRDTTQINAWYEYCKKADEPYVLCLNRTKLSRVEWDYITLSHKKEIAMRKDEDKTAEKLQDIYRRHKSTNSIIGGDTSVGYIDNLQKDQANKVANEIALILRNSANSFV